MPVRLVARGLAAAVVAFAGLVATPPAHAQLTLRVGPGSQFQPMPVAVADFAGEGDLGQRVAGIVGNNLQRSGYFAPVPRERFPERPPRASRRGAPPARRPS
jgi:TolB protein